MICTRGFWGISGFSQDYQGKHLVDEEDENADDDDTPAINLVEISFHAIHGKSVLWQSILFR